MMRKAKTNGKKCFRTGLCLAALLGSFAATSVVSESAFAAENHQLFATSNFVQMQTSLNGNAISAWSASGLSVGYAYRMGFSSALVFQYSAVSSAAEILLHGFSSVLDYAILGGQNSLLQLGKEALVDYDFPFRLGLFAGGVQRSYNLNSFIPANDISFDDTVPRTGSFLGVTGGMSLEIPINEKAALLIKTNLISPWFTDVPSQKGLVVEGGIGIGYLM